MAEEPTPTMDFNILLFNVGHGDANNISTKGITNDQKLGISKVLKVISPPPPMFVLSQDTIKPTKAKCLQKGLGYPDTSRSVNEEADIFHDLRHNNPTYSGTIIDRSKFKPFKYFERLTAWKVLLNGQLVLIVSWHGPHTVPRPRKKKYFRSLLDSVAKVQMKTKADVVVVGGDFNLEMSDAQETTDEFQLWDKLSQEGEIVGSESSSKDFLVFWPKTRVNLVKLFTFDFEFFQDSVAEQDRQLKLVRRECKIPFLESERVCETDLIPFDHKRVLFRLKLIPQTPIPFARDPGVEEIAEEFRELRFNTSNAEEEEEEV